MPKSLKLIQWVTTHKLDVLLKSIHDVNSEESLES